MTLSFFKIFSRKNEKQDTSTVGGIIKILSKYPKNLKVVIQGYEGGFEEIDEVNIIKVQKKETKSWWWGDYNMCGCEKEYDFSCEQVISLTNGEPGNSR